MTLLEAVGLYVVGFKAKVDHQEVHKELYRFVHWCGPDRILSKITPPEIGDYADQVGGTGTTPQARSRLQIVRAFLSYARKKGLIERNLAQHVRIRKSRTGSGRGQVRDAADRIELTQEGHAALVTELDKLRADRGPLAIQIRSAAADKDVRENVPLEAAREQLGLVESRIRDIEATLETAVVADPSKRNRTRMVKVGTRVSVKDVSSGREASYTLVHRSEAKPLEGKISDVSPMGKALLGATAGQEVEAKTPRGITRFRVMKVSS
jgi:transcription elongation factor GreA